MNKILFCSNVNVSEHFLATSQIFLYSNTHDEKNLIEFISQDSVLLTADIGEGWGSVSWIVYLTFLKTVPLKLWWKQKLGVSQEIWPSTMRFTS